MAGASRAAAQPGVIPGRGSGGSAALAEAASQAIVEVQCWFGRVARGDQAATFGDTAGGEFPLQAAPNAA